METQFKDWLQQLAADQKGGVRMPADIVRGEAYRVTFTVPWDATGGDAFSASLRLSPDATDPTLADFTVTIGAYEYEATEVALTLSSGTVAALPVDADGDGLTELVFSVQYTPSGGSERRLFAGNIYISGEV